MPRAGSKTQKFPRAITGQLTILRDTVAPKVMVNRMAEHFEVGRETVRDWENGYSQPRVEDDFREAFLIYLLDVLNLRNDIGEFERIWQVIMVELWEWQQISDAEFTFFLPGKARTQRGTLPLVGIPRQKYKLIGRQKLVGDLRRWLMDKQMVALVGLPGVGKTALAVEITRDDLIKRYFGDGIYWVGLGHHPDVLLELRQLARTLGVSENNVADPSKPSSWGQAIHQAIGNKHILFILDDVWQLQTANLFTFGGQNCAYLITTRIPTVASDFSVGQEVQVPELQPEDGIALLHILAEAVITTHPGRARKLAEVVGYLPLALILMGNYLRNQTLSGQQDVIEATLRKLSDNIKRLQIAEPQRSADLHPSLPVSASISLMAMIEISDHALDKLARSTLRALSVFPPKPYTFSEAAAVAVSKSNGQTLNVLYQVGLMELDRSSRFTLHQTIADYARVNLRETGPCERFVDFFADYVDNHQTHHDLLQLEIANILSALKMARRVHKPERLITGADRLYDFLENRGLYKQAKKLLTRAVKAARLVGNKGEIARALRNLAAIGEKLGDWDTAIKQHQEALSIVKELGDIQSVCVALSNISVLLQRQGEYAASLSHLQESLVVAQQHGLADVINGLQLNLGVVYTNLGQYDLARTYFDQSLPWARQAQQTDRLIAGLGNLGWLMEKLGRYGEASIYYQECLDIAQAAHIRGLIAKTFGHLGTVRLKQCLLQEATDLFKWQQELAEDISDRELIATSYSNLGQAYTWSGEYNLAITYLEDSLAIARKLGDPRLESEVRKNLGEVYFYRGEYNLAFNFLKEALDIARGITYQENISSVLSILAAVSLEVDAPMEEISKDLIEAVGIAYSLQHQEMTACALLGLVRLLIKMHDDEYAQALCEEGETIARQISHKVLLSAFLIEQGQLQLRRQDPETACITFVKAFSFVKDTQLQPVIAAAHFALAKGYLALDQMGMTRREATAALKIFRALSHIRAQEVQLWLDQLD